LVDLLAASMKNSKMKIYVGTSGFLYAHWNNGVFYPPRTKDRMTYAFSKMNVLEINSTFYSMARPERIAAWAQAMPPETKLILKGPQSVTHRRRLKLHSDGPAKQGLDLMKYFIEGYLHIPEASRGPALLQLPGSMEIDLSRLEPVLELFAASSLKVALEVRHASWFQDDCLRLLERYNAALVASDWVEFATPLLTTADFVYVRRHGPTSMYDSLYSEEALQADIEILRAQAVKEAYVLFNNDIHGYAPRNVMEMIQLIAEEGGK
jgi:uncharacterized protein YecE (DUF72 family)